MTNPARCINSGLSKFESPFFLIALPGQRAIARTLGFQFPRYDEDRGTILALPLRPPRLQLYDADARRRACFHLQSTTRRTTGSPGDARRLPTAECGIQRQDDRGRHRRAIHSVRQTAERFRGCGRQCPARAQKGNTRAARPRLPGLLVDSRLCGKLGSLVQRRVSKLHVHAGGDSNAQHAEE
jgi:hypothetical protein